VRTWLLIGWGVGIGETRIGLRGGEKVFQEIEFDDGGGE